MNKKSTSNINSEIEKFIINAHQKYKLGADAISKKMALPLNEGGLNVKISRAPIGKRLTKLKKAGKIKHIPHKERQSSKNMRGQYYNKKRNTYLDIRPITAIDKKTRNLKTGKLKYKIPKDAKFKVDFKNPTASNALKTKIPIEFLGIQYYKTKKEAERAVARNQERIKNST